MARRTAPAPHPRAQAVAAEKLEHMNRLKAMYAADDTGALGAETRMRRRMVRKRRRRMNRRWSETRRGVSCERRGVPCERSGVSLQRRRISGERRGVCCERTYANAAAHC